MTERPHAQHPSSRRHGEESKRTTDNTVRCVGLNSPAFVSPAEYTCSPFALSDVSSELDTVCAGQQVVPSGSSGSPFTLDCTGTADANSVHMTCTGGGNVAPNCDVSFTLQMDVTRSADTFYSVEQTTINYVGVGCGGAPPDCHVDHIHGTRISNASAYCATPTKPLTWGGVKAYYR